METYNCKYIKTWQDYQRDNPGMDENEADAIKEKITASEKAVFDFVVGLLL